MTTLSTHVLDTALGRPAAGVRVTLLRGDSEVGSGSTDADGRLRDLTPSVQPGTYTLVFATGPYFESTSRPMFYPEVRVTFVVADEKHYHVPLLLAPFGYSTYRGS
jgi:5-hydroxyisourate hydrolase